MNVLSGFAVVSLPQLVLAGLVALFVPVAGGLAGHGAGALRSAQPAKPAPAALRQITPR